jgi:hypothetical protein
MERWQVQVQVQQVLADIRHRQRTLHSSSSGNDVGESEAGGERLLVTVTSQLK